MSEQYRKKPEIVQAEQYKAGSRAGGVEFAEGGVPFVRIKGSKFARVNLHDGDWVLTFKDGTRDVMSNELFEDAYEKAV